MTQRHDLTVTEADHLSPMPTPHSRRGRRRGPKVVLVTLVLLLAPVLVLELFIRGLIALDRLPVAPSNSEQLDVGVVQVLGRPPQDVLLVGDSQMATGVDPAVLQKLLRRDLGERITVYNFGQPASTTESNRQVLELLVSERQEAARDRDGYLDVQPGQRALQPPEPSRRRESRWSMARATRRCRRPRWAGCSRAATARTRSSIASTARSPISRPRGAGTAGRNGSSAPPSRVPASTRSAAVESCARTASSAASRPRRSASRTRSAAGTSP